MHAKVAIESFQTVDGGQTISVSPAVSRRQKSNWYVWIKPDGSGLLVIDNPPYKTHLPANSPRDGEK
jgi:hypothetical protein